MSKNDSLHMDGHIKIRAIRKDISLKSNLSGSGVHRKKTPVDIRTVSDIGRIAVFGRSVEDFLDDALRRVRLLQEKFHNCC